MIGIELIYFIFEHWFATGLTIQRSKFEGLFLKDFAIWLIYCIIMPQIAVSLKINFINWSNLFLFNSRPQKIFSLKIDYLEMVRWFPIIFGAVLCELFIFKMFEIQVNTTYSYWFDCIFSTVIWCDRFQLCAFFSLWCDSVSAVGWLSVPPKIFLNCKWLRIEKMWISLWLSLAFVLRLKEFLI